MFTPVDAKPKNAVLYLRVSTEEQTENYSLGTQEDICTREATKRGLTVVEQFKEEGKSAKNMIGRPELIHMLEYCRKNKKRISAVLVYRLDRISRQTSDYLAIRKKLSECDISLISATEPTGNSPTEKLVETMLAGFAQLDNDVRSERTRNGMRARFLAGLNTSHTPLGYLCLQGYSTKDPKTFDLMKKAWDLMATGSKTLREMADIMNAWGIRERYCGEEKLLKSQTVSRLFKNKFYIGILTSEKYPEEIKGQHIPMISAKQYYRVQAILSGRNTNIAVPLAKRNLDNDDFPLRRFVICSKCGTVLTGAWSKQHRYAYYFCRSRCGMPSIPVDVVDNAVIALLQKVTPTNQCLNLFISVVRKLYMNRVSILQKRRLEADHDLSKLLAVRQALIEKNLMGVYSDDVFKEQNAIIEEKIISVRAAKDDSLLDKYKLDVLIPFMKKFFKDLGISYQNAPLTIKHIILSSIFDQKVAWGYPGISNCEISPVYQRIRRFEDDSASLSTPSRIRTGDLCDENAPS